MIKNSLIILVPYKIEKIVENMKGLWYTDYWNLLSIYASTNGLQKKLAKHLTDHKRTESQESYKDFQKYLSEINLEDFSNYVLFNHKNRKEIYSKGNFD